MDENIITTPEVTPVKRKRKSRAKTPVPPTGSVERNRTLDELQNVVFEDMNYAELKLVGSTQAMQIQTLRQILEKTEQQLTIKTRQNEKMLATMAYIRQTMDHATTSITLQIGANTND